MIPDLITSMISDTLYPLDKYGSYICVSVIENSSTPKARGLAIRECQMCVETVGLSAVGKKGILSIAKSFSEETLIENKTLFLDLIEVIIGKMSWDLKKFLKLCGTAYLSSKARESIEKRVSKRNKEPLKPSKLQQAIVGRRLSSAPHTPGDASRKEKMSTMQREVETDLHHRARNEGNEGPFKFSFNSRRPNSHGLSTSESASHIDSATVISEEITFKREANSGAAASLRERLKQIRDRHQPDHENGTSPIPDSLQFVGGDEASPTPPNPNTLLRSIMEDVDDLLSQNIPLGRNTEKSTVALIGLRKMHASLSNGSTDSTGTDPIILAQLRGEIASKTSFCVFKLAR